MHTWSAESAARPAAAWALPARPEAWAEWAPHVRGAWRLGTPEVEPGAVGAARLLGFLPVPAKVTAKTPGRSWTWRVGGVVEMVHRVERRTGGCTVALDLSAPGPLEAALAVSYGPVISMMLSRLARAAERA